MEFMGTANTKPGLSWNMVLVVGSLIFSLLIGEAVLALLETKQTRVNHRGFYEYDPVLGWKKKANARRVNATEEFRAVESTNSKGIRGTEYLYRKRADEFRVLVLGDSFAEGYAVDFENLFSEVLKSRLKSGANSVYYEVINAATVGYGTDQELLFYRHEGYKYNPDLVIVMFYENDVVDNVTRREIYGNIKPLFRIEDNGIVLTESPPPGQSLAEQPEVEAQAFDLDQWLRDRSRVYSFVATGLTKLVLTQSETTKQQSVPYDFRVLSTESDIDIDHAWKLTELLLVELKKSVQDSGARLLVFYVPSIHSVDPELWEATRKKYGMTGNRWDATQVESNLGRICAKRSIDCIATIGQFKGKAKSLGRNANCFYYPKDAHWNIQGHRLAGEILADYIRAVPVRHRLSDRSSDSAGEVKTQDQE